MTIRQPKATITCDRCGLEGEPTIQDRNGKFGKVPMYEPPNGWQTQFGGSEGNTHLCRYCVQDRNDVMEAFRKNEPFVLAPRTR